MNSATPTRSIIAVVRNDEARAQTLDTGFVEIKNAVIARAGILLYHEGGRVVRELRDPEIITREDSLASYEGAPVLLRAHPTTDNGAPALLTVENASKLPVIGSLRNVRADVETYEGEDVVVVVGDVLIWSKEGVDAIEQGVRQWSVGYTTSIDHTSGTYKGKPYDRRQSSDVGNHLVLTASARAGDITEFRVDTIESLTAKKGDLMQYTIDGVTGEVADALAPLIDAKTARIEEQEQELASMREELEELRAENQELMNAATSQEEEEGDSKEEEEQKGDSLEQLVKETISILDTARAMIGADYQYNGQDLRALRADCVRAVSPTSALDDLSDEAIKGAFVVAKLAHKKSMQARQRIADNTRTEITKADTRSAQQKHLASYNKGV